MVSFNLPDSYRYTNNIKYYKLGDIEQYDLNTDRQALQRNSDNIAHVRGRRTFKENPQPGLKKILLLQITVERVTKKG